MDSDICRSDVIAACAFRVASDLRGNGCHPIQADCRIGQSGIWLSREDQLAGVIELDGSIVGKSLKQPTPDTPRVVSEIPPAETPKLESEKTDSKEQKAAELERTLDNIFNNMGLGEQIGLERIDGEVVMRFPNELAFPSGASSMTEEFTVALDRISPVINQTEGEIHIAGHTDNIPVSAGSPYISNWDLSAARATSVLHYMIDQNGTDPRRMVIQGYGDSRPIADNATPEGRSQNRRVETRPIYRIGICRRHAPHPCCIT